MAQRCHTRREGAEVHLFSKIRVTYCTVVGDPVTY